MKVIFAVALVFIAAAIWLVAIHGIGVKPPQLVAAGLAAFGVALLLGIFNERAIAKEDREFTKHL